MRTLRWAALAFALASAPVAAHHPENRAAAPGWTLDGGITVPIVMSLLMFAIGWRRLRARSRRDAPERRRQAWLFAVGMAVLAAALVSPLHEAGERSFAAHMAEHELLMLLAAPLLVLARPLPVMLWAWPGGAREVVGRAVAATSGFWRALAAPLTATALQALALWAWHAPALFDRALASDGWHAAQHLSFIVTALLFWTAMLGRRAPRPVAALCLVATSIVSGALGALMAFATSPWYAGYARLGTAPFGLTPAEDQQVAGLLMWVPGGLVHALVALVLMCGLLRAPTREAAHVG